MTYTGWRTIALSSLAFYAVLALFMSAASAEIYPVFSWSLFSSIPNAHETYSIEFLEIGGKVQEPPLEFFEAKSLFDAVDKSPTDFTPIIFNLGRAIQDHSDVRVAGFRAQLEDVFPRGAYRYRILKVAYDPVEYWETHTYSKRTIIEEFRGIHS